MAELLCLGLESTKGAVEAVTKTELVKKKMLHSMLSVLIYIKRARNIQPWLQIL